jgi:hypothetical protein
LDEEVKVYIGVVHALHYRRFSTGNKCPVIRKDVKFSSKEWVVALPRRMTSSHTINLPLLDVDVDEDGNMVFDEGVDHN